MYKFFFVWMCVYVCVSVYFVNSFEYNFSLTKLAIFRNGPLHNWFPKIEIENEKTDKAFKMTIYTTCKLMTTIEKWYIFYGTHCDFQRVWYKLQYNTNYNDTRTIYGVLFLLFYFFIITTRKSFDLKLDNTSLRLFAKRSFSV